MKKLNNTKKTSATENYGCEFCKRTFVRESTMTSHICEYKHRWLERDRRGNQIGFQSFVQFYKKHSLAKAEKTFEEFIKSAYYTAFVKFGSYCLEINALNVPRLVEYYLKENIKIDSWASDKNYNMYLVDYLKTEDPFDAVYRSIEYCVDLAKEENIQTNDYLRYGNKNKICQAIVNGRISPWLLYQSESGIKFLDTLPEDLIKIVYEYINPVQWAIKFSKETDRVSEVKSLLNELKW
jgi:hypothetical protein